VNVLMVYHSQRWLFTGSRCCSQAAAKWYSFSCRHSTWQDSAESSHFTWPGKWLCTGRRDWNTSCVTWQCSIGSCPCFCCEQRNRCWS